MDIEKLRKKLGTLNDDDQSWRKIKRKPNRRRTTTTTRKDEEEKRVEKKHTTLKLKHPWNKIEDVEEVNVYIVLKEKMKVISFASEETRKSWRRSFEETEEEEEKVKTTKKKRPPALVKVIASKLETKSSTQKKKKTSDQQQRSQANVFIVTGSQPVVNEYDLERLGMTTGTAFARGAERIEEQEQEQEEQEQEQ
jgi:hypothetical protein